MIKFIKNYIQLRQELNTLSLLWQYNTDGYTIKFKPRGLLFNKVELLAFKNEKLKYKKVFKVNIYNIHNYCCPLECLNMFLDKQIKSFIN